jgi:glycosyltransferase involved in cell wall biosynthesis
MNLSVNPKKILLFVIPSLVQGGAEKVITNVITHLDEEKYDLHLALFEKKGPYLRQIPDYVKVYDLKKKSRYSFLKLILRLKRLFRKLRPNTVVSFLSYTNVVVHLAKFMTGCRFNLVTSVQTNLSLETSNSKLRRIRYFLYKFLFNHADSIVVPSAGVKQDLEAEFNIIKSKIKIIYTPIDLKKIMILKEEEVKDLRIKDNSFLFTLGRLTKAKGHPYLLRAYSRINEEIQEKFVILGRGQEEERLKSLVNELGIREHVIFLGYQKNAYKFINKASVFVLSSLWEGFPNVLLEAMACGVPVISTDCASGPSEIITNGKNGILVPPADEEALAEAMLKLLKNKNLRKNFSARGKRRAQDFRMEKILPQYEELF